MGNVMNIEISKEQYQRVLYKLLDMLYGPNLLMKTSIDGDTIDILSNDGEVTFRIYLESGRAEGCKKDLLVIGDTSDEIKQYVPLAVMRKKLFAKTILSYVNEKTNLDIDCIEFWFDKTNKHGLNYDDRYNFNVKKNKRIKSKD